ncbi:1-aminocyclopropane-1-carboxylate synthase-like protein 1 [Strongylocentrotus purpuratus]|uniref:Aminotransferase class I/classII large domain-containing protein n=1 Tax=Strongylocentrotus purpuratus TaxID=7668 RepID=A0A7M7PLL4_STRPU|nr:1-aminocyclopropane-1-carboxylate synthase-like protein 1 [Strongylocentrotus purpuratus]
MASERDISKRVESCSAFEFQLKDTMIAIWSNEYDEDHNKEGIINLSTAHNEAIQDLITEKLNQPDFMTWDSTMLPYNGHRNGSLRLRKALSEFLSCCSGQKAPETLDPEKFIVLNGVTSALSAMAYVLCDNGDTILTPAPMYGAIPRDLLFQYGAKTYPVHLSSKAGPDGREPFELTVPLLESALEKAKEEGHNVRALLLVNPVNPYGTVYTKQQVLEYLTFCKRHDLHCVLDEIYAASIYDESVESSSVFTLHSDELPDKTKTHVIWGMAKDFGMPGSPFGAVYSWNPRVLAGLGQLVDFYQIPSFIQIALAKLLEDKEWLKSYLPTHNKMLMESATIVMETLKELDVPFVKPSAGLFIWADFRKIITNVSKQTEKQFAFHCLDHGLGLAPGAAFYYNEFGWIRLVHALPKCKLIEGMKRLKAACATFQTNNITHAN